MKRGWLVLLATAQLALAQQVQFTPFRTRAPESYAPVESTIVGGIAIGDLDGDGLQDFVVAEAVGAVHVSRATGVVGGWQSTLLPMLHGGTLQLLDIDGDGDLDIVQMPRDAQHPSAIWVARNGPTGFAVGGILDGFVAQGSAFGDVDGDGDLDLVVTAPTSGGAPPVALFRNDGHGGLVPDPTAMPATLPFGLWPSLVDVDGDQDLDLVATAPTAQAQLLRNVGGVFVDASSSMPAAHTGYRTSAVGDLDGDGWNDVGAIWGNGDLEVFWGGAAGFTLQPAVVPGLASTLMQPADLDADGRADLIATTPRGLEHVAFAPSRVVQRTSLLGEPVVAAAAADVDGNGTMDLVFATAAAPHLIVWWPDHRPVEDAGNLLGFKVPAAQRFYSPLAGDVDGDGRADLLLLTAAGLAIDRSSGDGRYTLRIHQPSIVGGQHGVDLAVLEDIDRDGDLDLVIANDVEIAVHYNDGTGTFVIGYLVPVASRGSDGMRVVDLDGDGLKEIVRAATAGLVICRNLGTSFAPPVVTALPQVSFVEPIDFDGDGDLDLFTDSLVVLPMAGYVVLLNCGGLQFATGPLLSLVAPNTAAAFDVDGDGDDDLLVSGTLELLRNDGGGVFTNVSGTNLPARTGLRTDLGVADFDEDGDLDVFLAGPVSALLLNDGRGVFTQATTSRVQLSTTRGWQKVTVADFDEDGDLDVMGGLLVFSGEPQFVLANNLRQLRSLGPPRTGTVAEFDLETGLGFGPTGIALVAYALAQAPRSLVVPGLAGRLQLDPLGLTMATPVPVSPIGSSSIFLPVPATPALRGLDLWLQAAIVPFAGAPAFTNAVFERIVW